MKRLAKSKKTRWFTIGFLVLVSSSLLYIIYPLARLTKLSSTSVVEIKDHYLDNSHSILTGPLHPSWTPYDKISRYLIYSLICAEDANFFDHNGLDFNQITQSIRTNLEKRKYHRGASTITQQLVRLMALRSQKTLVRKFREAIGAVMIEKFYSKQHILTWYLNLVYFGADIYGIADASKHYFKTSPDLLTISESVHLVLILPGPNSWSKGLRNKSLTTFGKKRFNHLLTELYRANYITKFQFITSSNTGNFGDPVAHSHEITSNY